MYRNTLLGGGGGGVGEWGEECSISLGTRIDSV
jgi:hypothetical protein